MKTIGDKIKLLRKALGLSQDELAEQLDVTVRSIQRYESKTSNPDVYALARLAGFFNVSADYLLGLTGHESTIKEENFKINASGGYNRLYAHFLQCKHNPIIDPTKEYYAISLSKDLTSISAQTQWVGWADDDHTLELRRLAPIDPEAYVKLCQQVYEEPMVINSKEDVDVFVIFGGHAIIRTDICEKYLPLFCKDFVSPTREY